MKPDLTVAGCRTRQQRLLDAMRDQTIDLVILSLTEHVQWLTGVRVGWALTAAAAMTRDGQVTLVVPEKQRPPWCAADDLRTYSAQWHSTLRNDQRKACTQVLLDALGPRERWGRTGVEFSCFSRHFPDGAFDALIDIEPDLYRLRRRKEPDELECLRQAIDATGRMYQRARELIAPGLSEIHIYNQLQGVVVETFGQLPTGSGNDYQCGSPGGPPRDRPIEAGQLYILDLGPAYRGYFADNARTIAVSNPTDAQMQAWEAIVQVLSYVQHTVRPGVSARQLFQDVQQMLDRCPHGTFAHHLGHGIGLYPHEAPHLNPYWDDTFEAGDVFTAEPGLYGSQLNAGIRIENDYFVTEKGAELLTDFPLALKL